MSLQPTVHQNHHEPGEQLCGDWGESLIGPRSSSMRRRRRVFANTLVHIIVINAVVIVVVVNVVAPMMMMIGERHWGSWRRAAGSEIAGRNRRRFRRIEKRSTLLRLSEQPTRRHCRQTRRMRMRSSACVITFYISNVHQFIVIFTFFIVVIVTLANTCMKAGIHNI